MSLGKLPVLIGVGQFTDKSSAEEGLSPLQLMNKAVAEAVADTGAGDKVVKKLDAAAVVELTVDSPGVNSPMSGVYKNPGRSIANGLGRDSLPTEIYSATGGNSPQMLVNDMAVRIAEGRANVAVLTGCEALGTMINKLKGGMPLTWGDDPGGEPEIVGVNREGVNEMEKPYGLGTPVNCYPMFENAIRGNAGRTIEEHMAHLGKIMAPFTEVAAKNPLSWFPIARSPEELTTVTDDNRWVGFPYPKFLNSIIRVNQGAAVVMCSEEAADEMGIAQDKRVYLHGVGDAYEQWYITDRKNYYESPAIKLMGEKAYAQAGWSADDIDLIDLYSCFPSAVQMGADALGFAHDDPRGLTVTGGLPYFGGPGSAYVMHSIATMVEKLRAKKASDGEDPKGLVTANGWFVTKHSIGLYSTEKPVKPFEREPQSAYQPQIDAIKGPKVVAEANGSASIETYTVVHGRNGPDKGIIIGLLDDDGSRFVALTPHDPAIMADLQEQEGLGRKGTVAHENGMNVFTPA